MDSRILFSVLVILMAGLSCTRTVERISTSDYGQLPGGEEVTLVTLHVSGGIEVAIMTYGATVVSLKVPDRAGVLGDVVLGHDSLGGYLEANPYFGSVVGRYCNRIAGGQFTLNDSTYVLARNNGPNHLHGGIKGFDKANWSIESLIEEEGRVGVILGYVSADGEEGYPGELTVKVTYTLSEENSALAVDYEATTTRATPVNLTQHSYFNLAGSGDILDHQVMLAASRFTPVDSTLIPTGELRAVDGTPFDFRQATAIGARIEADNRQLSIGSGYDHNFVLDEGAEVAVRVFDPLSGRIMEIATTEPGIQFYTGNFLDGTITGKGGQVYGRFGAFCLETQHYPDSPNQPSFPSTVLRPGETYATRTVFAFRTDADLP